MKYIKIVISLFLISSFSCNEAHDHDSGHNHANEHMQQYSVEEISKEFDSEERKLWQKPDEVIALLGDLEGKTVIDIGAGTGYFSFRLAEKGAHVIAADVDDRFQDFIRKKMAENDGAGLDVELRKVPYDSPELQAGEAHFAIIVNTYHHIEDRIEYFKKVLHGLKTAGKLMVVDFQKKEFENAPHGPPLRMRLEHNQVIKELQEAGFSYIELNESLLDYQYIIIAEK